MGNKFSNKYIWVLMLVLGVFVMAVTALIGGNSSIRNAQQTGRCNICKTSASATATSSPPTG